MTVEEVLEYLRENPPKDDVSPEDIVLHLFQQGEIQMSDYLKLQEAIELAKKPLLEIKLDPEQMVWDIEKWLSYSEPGKLMFVEND